MSATPKKYKLSEVEMKNIAFRRMVMDYISNIINNDMGSYIFTDIRHRLGLKEDVKVELSEDGEWLTELPEEPKIIIP